jgi:hypothetical protein
VVQGRVVAVETLRDTKNRAGLEYVHRPRFHSKVFHRRLKDVRRDKVKTTNDADL